MKGFKTIAAACAVFFVLVAVSFGAEKTAPAGKKPVVIAAAGTSSSDGSSPITYLLDPECEGYWSPRSKDAGTNEGIYIRFRDPVYFNYIEIDVDGSVSHTISFQTFLDAQSSPASAGSPKKANDGSDKGGGDNGDNDGGEDEGDDSDLGIGITTSLTRGKDDKGGTVYTVSAMDLRTSTFCPLDYTGKSIFIKLAPDNDYASNAPAPKITAIRFFDGKEEPGVDTQPMKLELPRAVPARASASSTLEPAFAYDVSKLFDSQPDMAWSTNGKKSPGKGESVTIAFDEEQDIHGLLLWNGYQRSDMHFKANGRVKRLKVAGQTVNVKDLQGPQTVKLQKPIKASEIKLEIDAVYPGGSYKDVLISEMRFLGADGRILLPIVKAPMPTPPSFFAEVLDMGLEPFLHLAGSFNSGRYDDGYIEDTSSYSAVRFRSNGSFVIYNNAWVEEEALNMVVEGNWEPLPDNTIRVFGKKYHTTMWGSGGSYLVMNVEREENSIPAPRIFQSVMRVARFASLSAAEQESIVRYFLQTRWVEGNYEGASKEKPAAIVLELQDAEGFYLAVGGPDHESAVKNIVAKLCEENPLYIKSDVFTGIMMPRRTQD